MSPINRMFIQIPLTGYRRNRLDERGPSAGGVGGARQSVLSCHRHCLPFRREKRLAAWPKSPMNGDRGGGQSAPECMSLSSGLPKGSRAKADC